MIHKGTCYSGHYYGYIKDIDQIGTWIRPPLPTVGIFNPIETFDLEFCSDEIIG